MKKTFTFLCILILTAISGVFAQRKMENLGRGVVATRSATSQMFISWRLLGTEPADIGFNIYRSANNGSPVKLNPTVLTQGTNWVDATANMSQSNTYFVKPVLDGIEQNASAPYTVAANTPAQPFYKVPIRNTTGYTVKFIWVGDLDGDGEYDFVFDKQPDDASKVILLEAYKRDGTFLWQMDCGPNSVNKYNIQPGSSTLDIGHGDNFTVYDINGDGKSEVIVRTANGVKFSNGATVVEANNDKQFISVLNGTTGVEMARVPYNNPYLNRGPMNGHMGIAYLDGINPSVIWEAKNRNPDDSFNEMTTAWEWKNGTLVQKWQFLTGNQNCPAGHQMRTVDVNGDGKDDVVPMGFVINSDGTLMHTLGEKDIYHGDRFYVGDLDPARPGLEMYGIQQGYSTTGIMWYYCDAKTGKILLTQKNPNNYDMGRGMTGDLDPRYPGYEFHTFVDALYNVSGAKTSTAMPSSYPNLRFWWDGDLGSENLDNSKFTKWDYLNNSEGRLYTARNIYNVGPNTPGFYGDIMGDWREEVVYASSDNNSLTVFTTQNPTTHRIYTLPHNPAYRNSMTVRGYSQSHMTDYYLGYGMEQPPVPNIQKANKYWIGNTLVWDKTSTNWTSGAADATFADADTIMFDIRGNNTDTIRLTTDASPARIWAMNPADKDYVIGGTGKLTGAMDLIKAQAGTLTLIGNHEFTGATRISEGSLSINGSLTSPVKIQPKGSLGGSGLLSGGLTIEQGINSDGGRINPGLGTTAALLGTLTIEGNLTVPGKNNFAFDIIPGSAKVNDSIVVKGNLTFNGLNKLIISFANQSTEPGTYTLIKSIGTLTATKENFVIEGLPGVPKELLIENNEIKIRIAQQRGPASVVWKGSVNNSWDFENANFDLNGSSSAFVSKDSVRFDESAIQKSIVLNETVYTSGITFDAASNYTINGNGDISGSGDLVKLNNNNVSILSKNNTYTGKTIINGGSLTVATINSTDEPSSLGSAGASPENLVLNNSTLTINDFCTSNRGMTISGNAVLNVPSSESYAIFTGEITGAGSLTKEGSGSLFITRANTYTGETFLKNGTINLRSTAGNENGFGPNGTVTLENTTLNMEDIRLNNQARWNMIVPEGKIATFRPDGRCGLLGSLTGAGTLNVIIPYVRTDFRGNWSAFTGKINVSNSDFRIGNTFGYPKAAIHLASGVIYTTTGSNNIASIGELTGVAGTRISGAAWIIGAKNTDATFDGNIAGNSVAKVGSGTWTLTGTNMYTGFTNVNGGKLLVNNLPGKRGVGSGVVTVNSGAALGGNGAIKGALIVNAGGTIEPGSNSIGTLTDSTSITLKDASVTAMQINKTAGTKDLLKVFGKITYGGKLLVSNTGTTPFAIGDSFKLFEASSFAGTFNSIEPAPAEGMKWRFIDSTGTITVVAKTAQSITFSPFAEKIIGDADFDPGATASSGLPVSYSSSNENVATIVNSKIHIVGAGTSTIIASQSGNAEYLAAGNVSQTLTVNKKEQNIAFAALGDKTVDDADFNAGATASSGLPVSYSSSNTNVAAIINGQIHIVGGGTTIITASQQGDDSYNAAPSVNQELNVFVPPLVLAKNIEVELDANGNAQATAAQVDNGSLSYNGALNLMLNKTTFSCSDVASPVSVTLTGTDAKGYSNSAGAIVTVKDNLKPDVNAPSAQFFCFAGSTYTVPALTASDNCGIASVAYLVSGATQRSGSGADASGNFNTGLSTITWTVTDIHGNVSNASATVSVNSAINAAIPDVYAINSSTSAKNTIYLGYGPSSLTVNAAINGGTAPYAYQWNSGQNTSSISVSAEGTYTVTVTDAKGCQTTTSIVIYVLDARCGNKNDKVMVCHNGQMICIASPAVQAHLNHGDKLGPCSSPIAATVPTTTVLSALEKPVSDKIILYPNPVSGYLTIQTGKVEAGATVKVFNAGGLEVVSQRLEGTVQTISFSTLPSGVYVVQIQNGNQLTREKVIKE